jgi:hypothetical protein
MLDNPVLITTALRLHLQSTQISFAASNARRVHHQPEEEIQ